MTRARNLEERDKGDRYKRLGIFQEDVIGDRQIAIRNTIVRSIGQQQTNAVIFGSNLTVPFERRRVRTLSSANDPLNSYTGDNRQQKNLVLETNENNARICKTQENKVEKARGEDAI